MFKIIVLLALAAFAAADPKPGVIAAAPLAYSAGYVSPFGVVPAAAYSSYTAYSPYHASYVAPVVKSAYSPLAYSVHPYAYAKYF